MDHAGLVLHRPATLICTITNTTPQPPQETQFGFTPPSLEEALSTSSSPTSYKLRYEVCINKKVWNIQAHGQGILEVPGPQKTVRLQFQVVPITSGMIELPSLVLYRVDVDIGNGGGKTSNGRSGAEKIPLTNAQIYNMSRGKVVTVNTA